MTRKERLMATMRGEPVDRPPVCFYEINGLDEDPQDENPFNIYSHPSWAPLLKLTREKTDRIVMRGLPFQMTETSELEKRTTRRSYLDENGSLHTVKEIQADGRILREHTRRDRDVNTVWTIEHLLKDEADLEAWIQLPEEEAGPPDYTAIIEAERELGDSGIVMLDTSDALCRIASLFGMEDYTVIALTEPELFHRALAKAHRELRSRVEQVARELPGRLWRIYGPEYATPPYLPPKLYEEYVVRYDRELVAAIQTNGGYARIHQHGNLKDVLDYVVQTGCLGLDPIEPAPQGDVTLAYVRERYGKQLVLFGNLEVNDIELLAPDEFEKKVVTAIREGTSGEGRGFVLLPSAAPYGRILSPVALGNYQRMIEVVERMSGNPR